MYCCVNCFSELEIQRFIKEFDRSDDCDYCESKNVNVAEVDDVGGFIKAGINRYYEDAAHNVTYVSADGGYQLPTMDIYDILLDEEQIFGDALEDPHSLLRDLIDFDGIAYVRKYPYGSTPDEDILTWNEFSRFVKSNQRFTAVLRFEDDHYDENHPHNFLRRIGEKINYSLITDFYPGKKIYRARIINDDIEPNHENLTCPEPRKTRNSRMSPAGISYFYGALDEATCIAEVRPSVGEIVAVAEFEVLKELKIVDLSIEFDEPKSIFNEEYVFEYEEFFRPFFSHFVYDIARPIRIADSEIDYVPAQIFTEFIRAYQFQEDIGFQENEQKSPRFKVNGILFKSSLKKQGTSIVFFKGHDISTTSVNSGDDAWLSYKGFKKYVINEIQVGYGDTLDG